MTTNKRHQVRRASLRNLVVRVGAAVLIVGVGSSLALAAPAAAESPTTVVGLRLGSKGYSVAIVQQALQAKGFPPPGGVDGLFGQGTDEQVRAFQKSVGLNVTGEIDAATAGALGLSEQAGDGSASSSKSSDKASTSTGTSSVAAWTGLAKGASGAAVSDLQARLVKLGVTVQGGVDGHFGPGTEAAVSAYQKAIGFSATGEVNKDTAQALVDGRKYTPAKDDTKASAPAPTSNSIVGLKVGASGDAVKTLQQRLIDAGVSVGGGADGIYGALTAAAVRTFQTASGLPGTGAVDQATADAINKLGSKATMKLSGLARGASGASVIHLQNLLVAANVKVEGGVDGQFGPATERAVRTYQAAIGVKETGVVDDTTANALMKGTKASSSKAAAGQLTGLKAGALGSLVVELQNKLIKLGITVRGGADGIFGPATAEAVKAFQTSQGLSATGVVDQKTVDALNKPKPISKTGIKAPAAANGYAVYGERGNRVTALQKALIAAGISVGGGADGQFGAKTAAAIMAFQRQAGLPVSGKVDSATAKALGLSAMDKPAAPASPSGFSIKVFPVQPACGYVDTWGATRSGGRSHQGVDILAKTGQELYAVADGKITKVYSDYPGALAGNGVRLTMADGTYFFYAHMSQLADGIELGVPVKAGQVIGYVGSTGNAGVAHLHFEVHPGGGSPINPYPVVKAVNAC